MIPAAGGLLVLARPIVRMIFEQGEFGTDSTWLTTIALQCYAPGLVVFSLAKVFIPAFYALQDTKTPVRVGALAVGLNLILNITFILLLPEGIEHAGIALATVLAEAFSMTCLALILQRRIGRPDWVRIGRTAGRSLAATCLMIVGVSGICGLFPNVQKVDQIIAVAVCVISGGLIYLLAGILLRLREIGELVQAVFRR
jgi:putative peptidoglycan lipid II flippase